MSLKVKKLTSDYNKIAINFFKVKRKYKESRFISIYVDVIKYGQTQVYPWSLRTFHYDALLE